MPPKLTEEERIASDLKKAEYARNWRMKTLKSSMLISTIIILQTKNLEGI